MQFSHVHRLHFSLPPLLQDVLLSDQPNLVPIDLPLSSYPSCITGDLSAIAIGQKSVAEGHWGHLNTKMCIYLAC